MRAPYTSSAGRAAITAAIREARAGDTVVIAGKGASATVQIRSETLTNDQTSKLRVALFEKFQPKGADGKSLAAH